MRRVCKGIDTVAIEDEVDDVCMYVTFGTNVQLPRSCSSIICADSFSYAYRGTHMVTGERPDAAERSLLDTPMSAP